MAWKDILVHIDDTAGAKARLDAALALARTHGAHLTALYVVTIPIFPGDTDDMMDPSFYDMLMDENRKRAAAAEQMFQSTVKRFKGSWEWRLVEGGMVDELTRHGRFADLLVVGRNDPKSEGNLERSGMPDEVILDAGRPVLVVPPQGAGKTVGRNVLVGWDESRRAARAVHDALPALVKATRVEALTVDAGGTGKRNGAGDIAAHLGRHGVKAKLSRSKLGKGDEGDILLRRAKSQKADMIVMGAYGHWRFKELVLGGVTASVLANATVPVLMSH